jgi:hypothetical protein
VSPVRYELGFVSQKTAFFIVTNVNKSDLTLRQILLRFPIVVSPVISEHGAMIS